MLRLRLHPEPPLRRRRRAEARRRRRPGVPRRTPRHRAVRTSGGARGAAPQRGPQLHHHGGRPERLRRPRPRRARRRPPTDARSRSPGARRRRGHGAERGRRSWDAEAAAEVVLGGAALEPVHRRDPRWDGARVRSASTLPPSARVPPLGWAAPDPDPHGGCGAPARRTRWPGGGRSCPPVLLHHDRRRGYATPCTPNEAANLKPDVLPSSNNGCRRQMAVGRCQ